MSLEASTVCQECARVIPPCDMPLMYGGRPYCTPTCRGESFARTQLLESARTHAKDADVLVTSPTGGMKFDGAKVRSDLLPRAVLRGIAEVMTFGAGKYAPYNWQNVELHRYLSSAERHLDAVLLDGEELDKDSGLLHAWHYLTNACFIAWLLVNRPEQVRAYRAAQNGE